VATVESGTSEHRFEAAEQVFSGGWPMGHGGAPQSQIQAVVRTSPCEQQRQFFFRPAGGGGSASLSAQSRRFQRGIVSRTSRDQFAILSQAPPFQDSDSCAATTTRERREALRDRPECSTLICQGPCMSSDCQALYQSRSVLASASADGGAATLKGRWADQTDDRARGARSSILSQALAGVGVIRSAVIQQ